MSAHRRSTLRVVMRSNHEILGEFRYSSVYRRTTLRVVMRSINEILSEFSYDYLLLQPYGQLACGWQFDRLNFGDCINGL